MPKSVSARLVNLGKVHLKNTLNWVSRPKLQAQIDSLGRRDAKTNRAYWQKKWKDEREVSFAILSGEGVHVGNCGLSHMDVLREKAELWIYLGEELGSGYGRSAAEQLLNYGFEKRKLHRIYVRVLADNPRARAFFRSLNFKEEGRWRDDTCRGGKYIDSLWFSILSHEYQPAEGIAGRRIKAGIRIKKEVTC